MNVKRRHKSFKDLSLKQKDWLCNLFRSTYFDFLIKNKTHPNKNQINDIISSVYAQVIQRNIYISYVEVRKAFSSKLPRYRKIQIEGS